MKISKNDLRRLTNNIVRAGYCEFYYILRDECQKIGYATGQLGWNWDAYTLTTPSGRTVAICTGYRSMIGDRIEGLEIFEETYKNLKTETSKKIVFDQFTQKIDEYFNKKYNV